MIKRNPSAHLALCWVLVLAGCSGIDPSPATNPYAFKQPPHFPNATYTFANNQVTKDGFDLGKKLFFDPILSRDNSVSCNSCHQQSRAFADSPLHPRSIGVDNRMGMRNAPSLANMAFLPEFFWDGGVTHLDFVPINAIESEVEMDETLAGVLIKLNAHSEYPALFKKAFGNEKITSPYMLHALSQFMVIMVSADARYDRYLEGKERLTSEELAGLQIFKNKCASCHSGELFTDFSYRNNGLNVYFPDEGRARITEIESDLGKFRVPSLRNVELTAPYMHNAGIPSLQAVLDHYDEKLVDSPTLDPIFRNEDGSLGIPLTEIEKNQILAFLLTLTDREFTSNPLFRNND